MVAFPAEVGIEVYPSIRNGDSSLCVLKDR